MNGPRFEKLMENRYMGSEYERDLFDSMPISNPDFMAEMAKLKAETESRGGKPSLSRLQELTEKFQPADPTNPNKDFARELRLAVAEKLGLKTDEEMNQLGFFTAVKGPMDYQFGFDGYLAFSYVDKQGWTRRCMVSLDATRNPQKDEPPRADILVAGDVPDPSDDDFKEDNYLKKIDEYAAQVARLFQEKMERSETGFTKRIYH